MKKLKADVIIIGGGLAGIVAALELLDAGKKVIIYDRDKEQNFGGLANWSFGGMFFANSPLQRKRGIKDSIDLALGDWHSYAEFGEQDHWPKKWAEQFVHLSTDYIYHWLKKKGIRFFPIIHWVERGLEVRGNSVPRFHLVWGTGYALTQTLIKHLLHHKNRKNLQLCFGHRVLEFISTGNTVHGVLGKMEGSDADFEGQAETVIVACGGINGSIEKIKKHWYKAWGEPPETILNGAHPFAIGDLNPSIRKLNGHVTHLDKQWNYAAGIHHPKPHHPGHGLSLVPCKSALWLNYKGERLGPKPLVTGFDTRYLVERICQEEVKYSWQVLNMKIAYKEFAISGSKHNPAIRDKKIIPFLRNILLGNKKLVNEMIEQSDDIVIAHSIEELADKMNALAGAGDVDARALRAVIENYDRAIDSAPAEIKDEQIRLILKARAYRGDKVRTCNLQKIDDKSTYPLIAIREHILSRKSLGGIQTDLECRVLHKDEKTVIAGLYAIGEAAGFGGGGVHGLRSLEGTFLSGCVLTARLAARSLE